MSGSSSFLYYAAPERPPRDWIMHSKLEARTEDPPDRRSRPLPPPSIVFIEEQALIRDCLVRSAQAISGGQHVFGYPSLEEWQAAMPAHPPASLVVLCSRGQARADIERDLLLVKTAMPGVNAVVMSDIEDVDSVLVAFKGGARGYIPTNLTFSVAFEAMRLVETGGSFVPASCLFLQQVNGNGPPAPQGVTLTALQTQIVNALQRGKANKQIAYELDMCESTVKVHIRQIMKKLNARNRTEIAVLAGRPDLPKSGKE